MNLYGRSFIVFFVGAGMVLTASPLVAQESPGARWRLANLNPFRSKEEPRGKAELADSPPARPGWKLPSLPKPSFAKADEPGVPAYTPPVAGVADPSAAPPPAANDDGFKPLQRFNSGARGFFATAKDTVTRPFSRKSATATTKTKKNRAFNPFGSETAPEPVENANDWLKLPRPGPNN